MGQATLDLQAQGPASFMGEGAYLNRAGPWDIAVYVRRRGMDDLLATTNVDVPEPRVEPASTARSPWQNPLPMLPIGLLIGGIVLALVALP